MLALEEQAREDISKDYYSSPSTSGSNCEFVNMGSYGVKIYEDEEIRDQCYKSQGIAAEHELGPAVGVKFSITIDGIYSHCYITELAEALGDNNILFSPERGILKRKHGKEIDKIVLSLYDLGIDVGHDSHLANFGYLKGKLACIDFDEPF